MASDTVNLRVPAKGEYAKLVRMTAAALSSRMGMNFDQVDDVRMAAEEAFVYAVETLPDGSEVTFDFVLTESELVISVPLGDENPNSDEEAERRAAYATFILESVSDSYEFASGESGPYLRLTKRLEAGDGDQE
jgi:serine/threonine-protein kinase RsbW